MLLFKRLWFFYIRSMFYIFPLPALFLFASSVKAVTGVALRSRGMILRPSRPQSLSVPCGQELKLEKKKIVNTGNDEATCGTRERPDRKILTKNKWWPSTRR